MKTSPVCLESARRSSAGERMTFQELLRRQDLEKIAKSLAFDCALPMHDSSVLSSRRIEGIEGCIRADLEDLTTLEVHDFPGSEVVLIPWDSRKARLLGKEQVLACVVDGLQPNGKALTAQMIASMVWDLMADSYPVWPE